MTDNDGGRPRARGGERGGGGGGTDGAGVVLFNCTKGELFTPNQGYKQFARRLRTSHRPAANKDEVILPSAHSNAQGDGSSLPTEAKQGPRCRERL